MSKYGFCNIDSLLATRWGQHIFSYVLPTDCENGSLVIYDSVIPGEREIRNAALPDLTTKIALVSNPVDITAALWRSEYEDNYFINEKDKPFRAYDVVEHDIWSVPHYMITALDTVTEMPVVGNYVKAKTDGKYEETLTPATTESFIGELIPAEFPALYGTYFTAIAKNFGFSWVSIRVVKNQTV